MNLLSELRDRRRYQAVFADLRRKVRDNPYRLKSSPVRKALVLEWILSAEKDITRELRRSLRARSFRPATGHRNLVSLDKERLLYSLCWPDRILEAVLARLIHEHTLAHLSGSLYSFQKGRSNFSAVLALTDYLKEQQRQGRPVFLTRRDIKSYGENIHVELLNQQLRGMLGRQDDYFWELLSAFLQPDYINKETGMPERLELGLPAGFSLTPVCENLYLGELDRAISAEPGAFYARFGDDIFAAHTDAAVFERMLAEMDRIVAGLGLTFNPEKLTDACLADQASVDKRFPRTSGCDYLGYNVNWRGEVFVSTNKLQQLKKNLRRLAKYTYLANRRRPPDKIVAAVINSVNTYLSNPCRHPYLEIMVGTTTNFSALRDFDRWVAKLPLRHLHGTGHDRVFRYLSYRELRRRGLLSVVRLRNQAWRGR
jgi:hypothetical protein